MKLVWCPETAGKAYIDAVKLLSGAPDTAAAELVAALAGGWHAQCIVEAWAPDASDGVSTSLALSAAARHTGGRHVCVVPDERSRASYSSAMAGTGVEVLAGEAGEVMAGVAGVDFAVVDWRREDAGGVLAAARVGGRGAVIVCRSGSGSSSSGGGGGRWWKGALMRGTRVVRRVVLPIGGGVEIVHVGVGKGPSLDEQHRCRWIKHVDQSTGEEHVFRR